MKKPFYQLEQTRDVIRQFTPNWFTMTMGTGVVALILPEFPVRAGAVVHDHKRPDLSYKIDYAVLCDDDRTVYLIELKTDQGSRRPEQDAYLNKAKELNIPGLIKGIIRIYHATDQKYKKKYDYLINKLSQIGWINRENIELKNTAKDYDITVVYIQPRNEQNLADTISFDDICSFLTDQDDLTKRFVESLKEWRQDPS